MGMMYMDFRIVVFYEDRDTGRGRVRDKTLDGAAIFYSF